MDTRMYVMTHKQFHKPEDNMYHMLHVGREISDDLGYEGDNTGDHISSRNKSFCELTGIYWIWKNVQCDIVGICHYRRYFSFTTDNELFLTKDYIEETLQDYDVIVPNCGFTKADSVYEHYCTEHHQKDMDICREVIKELEPTYIQAFDFCMKCNLFSLGNMMITRKPTFDAYCAWLFPILFEVEKRTDISEYDAFQARLYGYLSERLLRVWLLNQSFKIKGELVVMLDPQETDPILQMHSLRKRLVSVIMKDLIQSYQAGNYVDVVDNEPLDVDFGGKIPVWLCWWQGIENAPELVKKCIESVKRFVPDEKASVQIITMENVGQYITLPEWVIKHFEQGHISLTHLSDILRFGLLYRYGGVWLDATYYVTEDFFTELFEAETFYTCKLPAAKWRSDITRGLWSGNFWYGKARNPFFRLMLNGFYEYWRTEDKLLSYFLIDDMIAAFYDEIPWVKELIDAVPVNNPQILDMQDVLNEKYSDAKWKRLTEQTKLFKLSYKKEWTTKTIDEKSTIYNFIISN